MQIIVILQENTYNACLFITFLQVVDLTFFCLDLYILLGINIKI